MVRVSVRARVMYVVGLYCLLAVVVGAQDTNTENKMTLTELMSWLPSAQQLLQNHNNHSSCVLSKQQLLQRAESLDHSALHVLDSWGKLGPGLLRGNVNQMGDYDQCVGAGGCYCLATVDLRLPSSLRHLDSQLHAHYFMTSTLTDPGHRMPRASLIHWAACLPDPCTADDFQQDLTQVLTRNSPPHRDLAVEARVDPDLCHCPRHELPYTNTAAILAWLFFCSIILLCLVGTVIEVRRRKTSPSVPIDNKYELFLEAFSVRRNVESLLELESKPRAEDISCLHGIRALNALGLLLSHKQMALLFLPLTNRTPLATMISSGWSMIGRAAILYTDSFILLSGLLTGRSLLRELSRTRTINIANNILSRFIRLAPCLVAIILFCTAILPGLGSGPLWGLLVDKYSTLCQQYWWRNLLFIHNQFPFDQMCLTHSHQVGIDMQLFLTAPLLVYLVWRWRSAGDLVLAAVAVWSSFLRYSVALSEQLSTVIYYGAPLSQLFRTATKTYILPTHRATVYCLGISLALFLHGRTSLNITRRFAGVGWILGVASGLFAVFAPYHMSWTDYVYDAQEAALYNMLAPVLWSFFIAWAVVACHTGYGGWFAELLSWKWFTVFTRISYAVYLTQFPIFFFNIAQVSTSRQYTFFTLVDVAEFAVVLFFSVVLTVTVDLPAQNLKKAFFSAKKRSTELENKKTENISTQDKPKEAITQPQVRNRLPG